MPQPLLTHDRSFYLFGPMGRANVKLHEPICFYLMQIFIVLEPY